jgi:plasmid stability protein
MKAKPPIPSRVQAMTPCQITVRNLSHVLVKRLIARAKSNGRSMSAEAANILTSALRSDAQ